MEKLIHYAQVLTKTILKRNKYSKDFIVLTMVLLSFLLYSFSNSNSLAVQIVTDLVNQYFNFPKNAFYYTHLTIGLLRSFIVFILVDFAMRATLSNRLLGFMVFLTMDMAFDLASIVSTDMYYAIKPFRYELTIDYISFQLSISFQSLYSYFEVFCVLFSFSKLGYNHINNKTDNNSNSNSWLFSSAYNSSSNSNTNKKQENQTRTYRGNKVRA